MGPKCFMQLVGLALAIMLTTATGPALAQAGSRAAGNGDYNGDGTINLADYAAFPACMAGPGGGLGAGCGAFDFNVDNDVDLADFAGFQRVIGTSFVPPPGMVFIPAGEFQMGDTFTEGQTSERPVHAVCLDEFCMDAHAVTNQQYADALNWAWAQGGLISVSSGTVYKYGGTYRYCETTTATSYSRITWNGSTFGVVAGKEDHPMVMVSWYGSVAYCNWRSAMEGKPLCYNLSNWTCNFAADGYRLPTEAEWEKAARGGAAGHRFSWSDTDTIQHARANYYSFWQGGVPKYPYDTNPSPGYHPTFSAGSSPYTSPVGYFAPNGYGLYDMTGNVWDRCNDWFSATYYSSSPYSNPTGPTSGTDHVTRGSSWVHDAYHCRVTARGAEAPVNVQPYIGFRCVAGIPHPVVCQEDTDCDDGVACTEDMCVDAVCVFAPRDALCDDDDLCTIDTCDPAQGCGNEPVQCSVGEVCDPLTGDCAPDCNANGIPDAADIAVGTSQDCQPNGVPDECEIAAGTGQDCQPNGIPDECDIAAGTSQDTDGDGNPDECVPPGMVPIPAGEFQMGDTFAEGYAIELPVHAVYLDAFNMDRFELTNQRYADALNWAWAQGNLISVTSGVVYKYGGTTHPYCSTTAAPTGTPHYGEHSRITWDGGTFGVTAGKEDHPMVVVTWYGAVAYCNWRSAMEGRTPCYNPSTWACNFDAGGYRLPTEAEWEKAARGGVAGHRFAWSDTDTIQHARANYRSSPNFSYDTSPTRGHHPTFDTGVYPYTSPVGYFAPNDYGLYDMTGSVSELCNDWYSGSYYSTSPYSNPTGPGPGTERVLRGGNWNAEAFYCRASARASNNPGHCSCTQGFRCVLRTQ